MPLCRGRGKGLWEVRSDLAGGRIVRVLFCIHNGRMVLLQTPNSDLDLAMKRMKEIA
jgi:hypothetical protein